MDKREEIATRILVALIGEPAPPEGYDWWLNQLGQGLPDGLPQRILLPKAAILLADSLLACLAEPPELLTNWRADEVTILDTTDDTASIVELAEAGINQAMMPD